MTAEIQCKVVKWLVGHIFDDNHAGIARQLLPVQPLEGLFSKTEYMKFKSGEELI